MRTNLIYVYACILTLTFCLISNVAIGQHKVGIGTSSPGIGSGHAVLTINATDFYTTSAASLELKGSSAGLIAPKANILFYNFNGETNAEIGSYATGISTINGAALLFKTADASNVLEPRMRIRGDGVIGIGNLDDGQWDPSAALHIHAVDRGFLMPKMNSAQREAISNPPEGLLVYDTSKDGVWHYTGTEWSSGVGAQDKISSDSSYIQVLDTGGVADLVFVTDSVETLRITTGTHGQLRIQTREDSTGSIFFGRDAGKGTLNDILFGATVFGYEAVSHADFTGTYTTAFGSEALKNLTSGAQNTALGHWVMQNTTTGSDNTGVGEGALRNLETGSRNTAIGDNAMFSLDTGTDNTVVGKSAGNSDDANSSYNVYIGSGTGGRGSINSTLKHRNVMVGYRAGHESEGDGNVFLGHNAGFNETGDDKLYIDNTATSSPLIHGDFASNELTVNGSMRVSGSAGDSWITSGQFGVGVTDPVWKLDVAGVINAASGLMGSTVGLRVQGDEAIWYNGTYFSWGFGGHWNFFADSVRIGVAGTPTHILQVDGVARSSQSTWATSSDVRVKENIQNIENASATISKFRPVTFDWKDNYKDSNPALRDHNYGFIAQEVEEIIPEMVTTVAEVVDGETIDDFRVLSTDALIPILVRAVQEQNVLIQSQQKRIEALELAQSGTTANASRD